MEVKRNGNRFLLDLAGEQSMRLLECTDNFFIQVIQETRRSALLSLLLRNEDGLIGNVKVKCWLACSDQKMVDLKILRAVRRGQTLR